MSHDNEASCIAEKKMVGETCHMFDNVVPRLSNTEATPTPRRFEATTGQLHGTANGIVKPKLQEA